MNKASQPERIVWSGRTSAFVHARQYFLGALFGIAFMPLDSRIALIPLAICTWYWLTARSMRYELTRTRLIFYCGVLSKQVEEMDLREIQGFDILQPWSCKLFSVGTVLLMVDESAEYQPCVIGIPDPERFVERISKLCAIKEQ